MVVLAITIYSRFWWRVVLCSTVTPWARTGLLMHTCTYMYVCQVKLPSHLFSTWWIPLTISFKADLLALNSLHFYFSGNVFYFLTFRFWNTVLLDKRFWLMSFVVFLFPLLKICHLNMSFYSLLAPFFLMRNQLLISFKTPLNMMNLFSLAAFKIFSWFLRVWLWYM